MILLHESIFLFVFKLYTFLWVKDLNASLFNNDSQKCWGWGWLLLEYHDVEFETSNYLFEWGGFKGSTHYLLERFEFATCHSPTH
jgi:hypothetical protein